MDRMPVAKTAILVGVVAGALSLAACANVYYAARPDNLTPSKKSAYAWPIRDKDTGDTITHAWVLIELWLPKFHGFVEKNADLVYADFEEITDGVLRLPARIRGIKVEKHRTNVYVFSHGHASAGVQIQKTEPILLEDVTSDGRKWSYSLRAGPVSRLVGAVTKDNPAPLASSKQELISVSRYILEDAKRLIQRYPGEYRAQNTVDYLSKLEHWVNQNE